MNSYPKLWVATSSLPRFPPFVNLLPKISPFRLRRAGALPLHPTRGGVAPSGLPPFRLRRPGALPLDPTKGVFDPSGLPFLGEHTCAERRATGAPHDPTLRGHTVAVMLGRVYQKGDFRKEEIKTRLSGEHPEGVQRATGKPSGRAREQFCQGEILQMCLYILKSTPTPHRSTQNARKKCVHPRLLTKKKGSTPMFRSFMSSTITIAQRDISFRYVATSPIVSSLASYNDHRFHFCPYRS